MKKKILVLFLTLSIGCTLIPANVSASQDESPFAADTSISWTKLSSAEKMMEGCSGLPETMLRYACRNGKLYAFNADVRETDGKEETDVFCSEYDIEKDTWSDVKKIGTFDVGRLYKKDPVFFNTAAYSAQGKICLIMMMTPSGSVFSFEYVQPKSFCPKLE